MNEVEKLLDNVVQVQIDNETSYCLGILIAPQLIITAALCLTYYGTSVFIHESQLEILKKYVLKVHLGVLITPRNKLSDYIKLSNLDDIYLQEREGVTLIIENGKTVLQKVLLGQCEQDSHDRLHSICGSVPYRYKWKLCHDTYGSPLFINNRIVGIASTSQCYKHLRKFYVLASVLTTIQELAHFSTVSDALPVVLRERRSLDFISIMNAMKSVKSLRENNISTTTSSLKLIRLKIRSKSLSKSTLIVYLERIKDNVSNTILAKIIAMQPTAPSKTTPLEVLHTSTSKAIQTASESTVAARTTNVMDWFNRLVKNKQHDKNKTVVIFRSTTPMSNVEKHFDDLT